MKNLKRTIDVLRMDLEIAEGLLIDAQKILNKESEVYSHIEEYFEQGEDYERIYFYE